MSQTTSAPRGSGDDSTITTKKNDEPKTKAGAELPADRAEKFFEHAKQLSIVGENSSLEVERILRNVYKAVSFVPDDFRHYMFLAKMFRISLDFTSSISCYRYVLRLDPMNISAKRFLSELMVLRGKELMLLAERTNRRSKYFSARSCFEEALEVNREEPSIWVLKAVCHIHEEDLTYAYDSICRAIKPGKTKNAEYYILRAKILWGRGLIEQGNADIRVAQSLDPNHIEVLNYTERSFAKAEHLYRQALQFFVAGEYKDALQYAEHALSITTDDVKLHILVSKIHRKMGENQSAYTAILKAKSIFENASAGTAKAFHVDLPSDIVRQINLILNEMAIKFASGGEYDKAILLYNKILKNEKAICRGGLLSIDFNYYVNRGDCFRALLQLPEAISDYMEAISINPANWDIRTRLSLTHYLTGTNYFNKSDYSVSLREFDKAIEFNPKVAEYYAVRGKAHYYCTNFQEAYKDFKKTLELDANNADVKIRLAQFESNHGETGENGMKNNKNKNGKKSKYLLPDEALTERNGIVRLKPDNDDMIQTLLNPRLASKLPTLKLMKSSNPEVKKTRSASAGSPAVFLSAAHKLSATIGTSTEAVYSENMHLPPVSTFSPMYRNAYIAQAETIQRTAKLHNMQKQRMDHNKDHLWDLVSSAQKLAQAAGGHMYREEQAKLKALLKAQADAEKVDSQPTAGAGTQQQSEKRGGGNATPKRPNSNNTRKGNATAAKAKTMGGKN